MAGRFGVTATTVRKWIEGKGAVVKQSQVKSYWKRDDVLGMLGETPDSTKARS